MPVDEQVRQALETSRVIDVTSIGRKSGKPHRMEIPIFNVDGRLFLIGDPRTHDEKHDLRPRDWYANMAANPQCTVHLKTAFRVDLPASRPTIVNVIDYDNLIDAEAPALAHPVRDRAERQRVLGEILPRLRGSDVPEQVADWVEHAPVVEIELVDDSSPS
jgi:hypothetical protein